MEKRSQMLETLRLEIASPGQEPQPMPGGFVSDLHPGCGLLNDDETMAFDPLEHQPVTLGNTHFEAVPSVYGIGSSSSDPFVNLGAKWVQLTE